MATHQPAVPKGDVPSTHRLNDLGSRLKFILLPNDGGDATPWPCLTFDNVKQAEAACYQISENHNVGHRDLRGRVLMDLYSAEVSSDAPFVFLLGKITPNKKRLIYYGDAKKDLLDFNKNAFSFVQLKDTNKDFCEAVMWALTYFCQSNDDESTKSTPSDATAQVGMASAQKSSATPAAVISPMNAATTTVATKDGGNTTGNERNHKPTTQTARMAATNVEAPGPETSLCPDSRAGDTAETLQVDSSKCSSSADAPETLAGTDPNMLLASETHKTTADAASNTNPSLPSTESAVNSTPPSSDALETNDDVDMEREDCPKDLPMNDIDNEAPVRTGKRTNLVPPSVPMEEEVVGGKLASANDGTVSTSDAMDLGGSLPSGRAEPKSGSDNNDQSNGISNLTAHDSHNEASTACSSPQLAATHLERTALKTPVGNGGGRTRTRSNKKKAPITATDSKGKEQKKQEPIGYEPLVSFRSVKALFEMAGYSFKRDKYCFPGMDPDANTCAVKGTDYFVTLKDFRAYLCANRIRKYDKWSAEELGRLDKWVRYFIYGTSETDQKIPIYEPMKRQNVFPVLKTVGFRHHFGSMEETWFHNHAPGWKFTKEYEGLWNHILRFGLPDSCKFADDTDRFRLFVHLLSEEGRRKSNVDTL